MATSATTPALVNGMDAATRDSKRKDIDKIIDDFSHYHVEKVHKIPLAKQKKSRAALERILYADLLGESPKQGDVLTGEVPFRPLDFFVEDLKDKDNKRISLIRFWQEYFEKVEKSGLKKPVHDEIEKALAPLYGLKYNQAHKVKKPTVAPAPSSKKPPKNPPKPKTPPAGGSTFAITAAPSVKVSGIFAFGAGLGAGWATRTFLLAGVSPWAVAVATPALAAVGVSGLWVPIVVGAAACAATGALAGIAGGLVGTAVRNVPRIFNDVSKAGKGNRLSALGQSFRTSYSWGLVGRSAMWGAVGGGVFSLGADMAGLMDINATQATDLSAAEQARDTAEQARGMAESQRDLALANNATQAGTISGLQEQLTDAQDEARAESARADAAELREQELQEQLEAATAAQETVVEPTAESAIEPTAEITEPAVGEGAVSASVVEGNGESVSDVEDVLNNEGEVVGIVTYSDMDLNAFEPVPATAFTVSAPEVFDAGSVLSAEGLLNGNPADDMDMIQRFIDNANDIGGVSEEALAIVQEKLASGADFVMSADSVQVVAEYTDALNQGMADDILTTVEYTDALNRFFSSLAEADFVVDVDGQIDDVEVYDHDLKAEVIEAARVTMEQFHPTNP